MIMEYLSFYLCLLQFLSSTYYSFQCASPLVKFIPRYFLLFDAIVNGMVFLIFLSASSLLVYRNTTHFLILIWYPANWLNLFISPNSFLVWSLGFFKYIISCHLQINFTSSLPIWLFFLSFPCLIALARTSNAMLNKSDKGGHPCLFLILEEKLSALHHWVWC